MVPLDTTEAEASDHGGRGILLLIQNLITVFEELGFDPGFRESEKRVRSVRRAGSSG